MAENKYYTKVGKTKPFCLKMSWVDEDGKEQILEQEYNLDFKEAKATYWHWAMYMIKKLNEKYIGYRNKTIYIYIEKKKDFIRSRSKNGEVKKGYREAFNMIICENGYISEIIDDDIANNIGGDGYD